MTLTTTPTAMAAPPPPGRSRTGGLLWTGVLAGPLFLAAALLAGAVRDGYEPLRHPVGSLSIGPHGWIQITNFIVTGLLTLTFAVALRKHLTTTGRRSLMGPLLIAVWAIGLVGAGIFVGDPISGYPVGIPATGIHTWHGQLHDIPFSTAGFGACLVFAWRFAIWRQPGWAVYSGLSAILFATGTEMSTMGFMQGDLVGIAGLLQRVTVAIAWAWLTALAVYARRNAAGRRS